MSVERGNPDARGRFIGLGFVVVATIASAAILLAAKTSPQSTATNGSNPSMKVPGFVDGYWYLPDEALLGFVAVPAGEFLMGSDPAIDRNAYDNEVWSTRQRRGRVMLPDFYMSRYEVTVAQFKAFVNSSQYSVVPDVLAGELNHPVTQVTLPDALAYCRWLQVQMLASDHLPVELAEKLQQGWRVTLPTEAQWEKAARGTQGKLYPWGNQATTTFANYRKDHLRPVGSKACPNCTYQLADMSGNVWELTRSYYLPYPFDAQAQPDLERDALFVMRGGSFADNEQNVRAAVRGGVDPGARNPAIGFRIVFTP